MYFPRTVWVLVNGAVTSSSMYYVLHLKVVSNTEPPFDHTLGAGVQAGVYSNWRTGTSCQEP